MCLRYLSSAVAFDAVNHEDDNEQNCHEGPEYSPDGFDCGIPAGGVGVDCGGYAERDQVADDEDSDAQEDQVYDVYHASAVFGEDCGA